MLKAFLASLILIFLGLVGAAVFLRMRYKRNRFGRSAPTPPPETSRRRNSKKPEWVAKEVVRLKALLPFEGCRNISTTFNRVHLRKNESVGKTFVAGVLKAFAVDILRLRNDIKNRKGHQSAKNVTWAADESNLTRDKVETAIFGLIDHGTRACLVLSESRDRSTIGILRLILDAIERYGRPRVIRTDNGPGFRSRLFTLTLALIGIRHQRIDPFCPWQKGRIERLFGTFKERLALWWQQAGTPLALSLDLETIRVWYNHARPHQSLDGLTPAMAWDGKTDHDVKSIEYFHSWNGILAGFVSRC